MRRLLVELKQGDDNQSGQRSLVRGSDSVRTCTAVLLRARRAGAERPVGHHHRQRRHSLGYHRTCNLESAGQTVYATRRLPGDVYRLCGNGIRTFFPWTPPSRDISPATMTWRRLQERYLNIK